MASFLRSLNSGRRSNHGSSTVVGNILKVDFTNLCATQSVLMVVQGAPHGEDVNSNLHTGALCGKLLVEGVIRLPQLALLVRAPHLLIVARLDLAQACAHTQ